MATQHIASNPDKAPARRTRNSQPKSGFGADIMIDPKKDLVEESNQLDVQKFIQSLSAPQLEAVRQFVHLPAGTSEGYGRLIKYTRKVIDALPKRTTLK